MSINSKMTALADAIREKSGRTDTLTLDEMATAIQGIETGTDTSDATATAGDILSGKTAYVDGEKVTGTIATKTSSNLTASGATITVPAGYYANEATKSVASGSAKTPATTVTKNPSISVNSSGLITASVSGTQSVTPTVSAGYVSSGTAGTITVSGSATKQLTTQAAKTVTPTTSNQTAVASGRYTTGAITVKGDANLVGSNIKKGVSIFGVTGTVEEGEDVTTETNDYTAKITQLESAVTALETELQGKASGGGGGSVETCTVTFDNISYDCSIVVVSAMVAENGIHQTYTLFKDMSDNLYTIDIPNVVCGSEIGLGSIFDAGAGIEPYIDINGTASFKAWSHLSALHTEFMTLTFTAPSVSNENCIISFMGNV